MAVIRLCICPCGRVSVQEPDEDPACYKCGGRHQDQIDWFNLDAGELKEDLAHALSLAVTFQDIKQTGTETPSVTGVVATIFEDNNNQ
jgi:hypothetical protein